MPNKNNIDRREALKRSGIFVGGVLSLRALATAMQGCQTSMDPDWTPAFFSQDESDTLGHLAEAIIPRTDTPGALDAKVHRYLDVMASKIFPTEESEKFRSGLTAFSATVQEKFGKSFGKLSEAQKTEAIKSVADDDFFKSMRSMTIAGFFTSEVGAKDVLQFDPIPGEYNGCMPLEEIGGTWAI